MQEYLTEVTQKKYLTLDIVELVARLVAPEEIAFQAGQFMEFKIGETWQHHFIANPPSDDPVALTFCLKLATAGPVSDYIKSVSLGSEVVMRGPAGEFVVKNFDEPVCFITDGPGISPFASMVPDMLVRGFKHPMTLLFGLRSEENVFYFDRFRHLSEQHPDFKFIPILSRPVSHWPGEIGRITTWVKVNYDFYKERMFYLCGSRDMVTEVRDLLLENHHDPHRVKTAITS